MKYKYSNVILCHDVELIKTKLIQNPLHSQIMPEMRALEQGSKYCEKIKAALGVTCEHDVGEAKELIKKAGRQIGAAAAAVAIYVTAVSSAKTSTKLVAIRAAKKGIETNNIELPIALMSRLGQVIAKLAAEAKSEGGRKK